MIQTMIYDYLGLDADPFYLKLKQLKKGNQIKLGSLIVHLNNLGIYEVSSNDIHEGFKNITECYQFVLKNMEDNNVCTL
ncbi:hypothetical protein [Ornithinibacillus sp. JPR2-1]|uniref:hypothetical protein n=1 Tax=Ornithinibacillus sp. JPR2-1 TaxID=2094019 RepID=UPI0031D16336